MQTQTQRIVVIGAGYAGLLAAVRLAGKTRRKHAEITLVNGTDTFIERLRLHQLAANQDIPIYPIADRIKNTGIRFVQGWVTAIDLRGKTVSVKTAQGASALPYDHLLYALGSTIEQDSVPGIRDHAHTLTPSGARSVTALREILPALNERGGRVIVVGGGATGVEAAAEFADCFPNLKVELVTADAFGSFISPPVASYLRESLETLGVAIRDCTRVTAIEAGQLVTERGALPFDVCLWAGGFAPLPLARESGLAVNERGQILVDPFLRSVSHPAVMAAGDAAHPVEQPGAAPRMSAMFAITSGAHAADVLAATVKGKQPAPLSFSWQGQCIALGRHNGIGFALTPDDVPKAPLMTGALGLKVREFVVRVVADLPNIERRYPGAYWWTGKGRYAADKRKHASLREGAPVARG